MRAALRRLTAAASFAFALPLLAALSAGAQTPSAVATDTPAATDTAPQTTTTSNQPFDYGLLGLLGLIGLGGLMRRGSPTTTTTTYVPPSRP
jgi:hypothetical protein